MTKCTSLDDRYIFLFCHVEFYLEWENSRTYLYRKSNDTF